ILGIATGVALACICKKKMDREYLTQMCDSTSKFFDKAKQKIADGIDTGKDKIDNLADRAEGAING
ncbi:MAG: hypothetical protein LIP04_02795, partial [Tannerellaceae bacterium]|nr:hypothetical protein [Tannerellaceae bacterium]